MTVVSPAHLGVRARPGGRLARRRVRTHLLEYAVALLTGPALLAVLFMAAVSGDIEAELTARARASLAAYGLPGIEVSFSGRDAHLEVPDGVSVPMARQAVAAVEGVRSVDAVQDRVGEPIGLPPAPQMAHGRGHGARTEMGWLAGGSTWWLVLAFGLGAGTTWHLLVRRVPARSG